MNGLYIVLLFFISWHQPVFGFNPNVNFFFFLSFLCSEVINFDLVKNFQEKLKPAIVEFVISVNYLNSKLTN